MTASLIRPLMLACGWAVCCALSLVGLPSIAVAGDWPQWMGPTRDGVIHEEIIEQFPEQGLKILWRTPIAGGYAGPAVAAGKVFVPDFQASAGKAFNDPGTRAKLKGTERLLCLDATNGQVLWKDQIPCDYSISYPAGPRCTPTVDGELVYMLGAQGDLRCLKVKDGSLVWKRNLSTDLNAPVPLWGHSAHPLVDGPRLICMVGGKGKAVVALNKLTGEELWRSLDSSEAGYAPAVRHETNGQAQVVVFHPKDSLA